MTKQSQLLSLLTVHKGQFIPAPEIAAKINTVCVGTMAADLRKKGYIVENVTVSVNGQLHSYYRLV